MIKKQLLYDLFRAYYGARRNKRSTINALKFEMYYEKNLFELYEEIKNGKYKISRSICFMSFNPVQREIFAGDFREPVIDSRKHNQHRRHTHDHVEVGDDEVGIRQRHINGHVTQEQTGEATVNKREDKTNREQHRNPQVNVALP